MFFSVNTKEALSKIMPRRECCRRAELAGLLRTGGYLLLSEQRRQIRFVTSSAPVARQAIRLLRAVFNCRPQVLARRDRRLKKSNSYAVVVAEREVVQVILETLGRPGEPPKKELVEKACCRKSYLRGVFLAGGSIAEPGLEYHLEMRTADDQQAVAVADLIAGFGIRVNRGYRRNGPILYIKNSQDIAEFLRVIGASNAVLELENTRILREMRNQVNRRVNAETYNLQKTADAAVEQVEDIKALQANVGLDNLPESLRELAKLRLSHPEASLRELGAMLDPPLGKSGVNHRMRKLRALAKRYT